MSNLTVVCKKCGWPMDKYDAPVFKCRCGGYGAPVSLREAWAIQRSYVNHLRTEVSMREGKYKMHREEMLKLGKRYET